MEFCSTGWIKLFEKPCKVGTAHDKAYLDHKSAPQMFLNKATTVEVLTMHDLLWQAVWSFNKAGKLSCL